MAKRDFFPPASPYALHLVVFTLSVVVLPSLFSICLTVSFNVPPASQLIALFLTNSQTHASSSRRYETV